MTEESQQEKEGFSQRVEEKCHEYAKKITRISFLFRLTLFLLLLFIIASFNSYLCWPSEEKFALVKFIGSALGLVFGFLLFAQRLDTMNKQAKTAQDQVEIANRQIETANRQIETTQNQHESEQFKQACELLGHEKMIARMGGITILNALARTKPEEWHIAVVNTLALFIRNRSVEDENSPIWAVSEFIKTTEENKEEADKKWQIFNEAKANKAPADIEEAMRAIACDLTNDQKAVVQKHLEKVASISDFREYWPDLSNSWLCSINLISAYLPKVNLMHSFLCLSELAFIDLTGANLKASHLDGTPFSCTNLQAINFGFTNVTSADFIETTGLETCELESWYCVENKDPHNLPDNVKKPESITDKDYPNAIRAYNEKRGATLFRTLGELKSWESI